MKGLKWVEGGRRVGGVRMMFWLIAWIKEVKQAFSKVLRAALIGLTCLLKGVGHGRRWVLSI